MARSQAQAGSKPPAAGSTAATSTNKDGEAPAASSSVAATAGKDKDRDKEKAVKVNPANLTELKNCCDDAVKFYLRKPGSFTRSHVHEDVRLVVGWTATIIGGAAGWYGYQVPFKESKRLVSAGVFIYVFLSAVLLLYTTFIEKDTIYLGKRKTVEGGRISTERLVLASSAYGTPASLRAKPLLPLLPSPPAPSAEAAQAVGFPLYNLRLKYIHSSNNGKSLIRTDTRAAAAPFGDWFDDKGTFAKDIFERWLEGRIRETMGGQE